MLRYVSAREATVWVETDAPCTVEILGHSAATFQVAVKHYALVVIRGLEPASSVEYEVHLDGRGRRPPTANDYPPSRIQTLPERVHWRSRLDPAA